MTYTPLLKPAAGGTGTSTTFTAGSVVFTGASGGAYAQDNTNLFWDDTNNKLSIQAIDIWRGAGAVFPETEAADPDSTCISTLTRTRSIR